MLRLLRRLAWSLTLAALLLQASGVANAFEVDPIVHCCCGDHDADHPCACPSCPGHGEVRLRVKRGVGDIPEPTPSIHACHGQGFANAIPPLPALLFASPLHASAPRLLRRLVDRAPRPLHDRTPEPSRPPP